MVKVSVIIPTLNEEGYIEKTLIALKPQLEKGDELIVIDGYSKDNTVRIAKKFGAKVYYMPREGIGPAKTLGAKKAKNTVIAMLDADGVPAPNWLKQIKTHFRTEHTNAVAGLGLYYGETKKRSAMYNIFSKLTFDVGKLNYKMNRIPWMPVNNCAIKKDFFLRFGGLHNVVCEDLDFAMRAKGIRNVVYDKKLNVTLSDRRFVKEGFFRTVWVWTKSDIAILRNKNKVLATDYNATR
jgi:glycosyltransferase involved in cell wall biosynthesis